MKTTLKTRSKGFTLVELVIVIAIIGILATVGVQQYTKYLKGARDSQRQTAVISTVSALNLGAANTGVFPLIADVKAKVLKDGYALSNDPSHDASATTVDNYCYVYVTDSTTEVKEFAVIAAKESAAANAVGSDGFIVAGTAELSNKLNDTTTSGTGVSSIDCKTPGVTTTGVTIPGKIVLAQ